MKRILIISITLLFVFLNNTWINAQNTYNSETILIEGGVGVPNFYRMVFRNLELENSQQYTEIRSNGFGPFTLRVEKIITEKLGIGLDFGYVSTNGKYTETYSYINEQNEMVYEKKEHEIDFKKIGVMATLNVHLAETENLDLYVVFGIGIKNSKVTFKSDLEDSNLNGSILLNTLPIASRIGFGMKYYFTSNLGANLNAGIGQGGLLNVGLTYRINPFEMNTVGTPDF